MDYREVMRQFRPKYDHTGEPLSRHYISDYVGSRRRQFSVMATSEEDARRRFSDRGLWIPREAKIHKRN